MSDGRNIKSSKKETANDHERPKNFLSDAEIKSFLDASKKTRYPKKEPFSALLDFCLSCCLISESSKKGLILFPVLDTKVS